MLIKAENITKTYRNAIGKVSREVLSDLSLEISAGEKIAIMGPSGSGKTTLLNLLGSLDHPDKGTIRVEDRLLTEMNPADIRTFRNRKIGFIFQFHHLLPQCTLWENVLLPTLPHGDKSGDATQRAGELLKFLDIWPQRTNKPGELSGGECQRAAVARALINQPEILLADEPTGSLDAANSELLMQHLLKINEQMGVTLIIATHSSGIAEKMDTVYQIENGQLKTVNSLT